MKRVPWALVCATAVTMSLAGCAPMRDKNGISLASAAPLDPALVAPSLFKDGHNISDKKDYLGAVVLDSIQKCQAFVNTLDLNQGDANFLGDSFSTLFSALATVTKPINTVHGLTAASTIASGTKNAYLSGYFANATIANFGMAMQTTYFTALQQYIETLPHMADSDTIVPLEIGKIESIHALCSMASAQYVITKTLGKAASTPSAANIAVEMDFDPSGTAKVSAPATLTVTLVNGSGKAATLSQDMTVSVTSDVAKFSLKSASTSGSSCDARNVKLADDGFAYQKSAIVPAGGCAIKVSTTLAAAGKITAEVKADALKTDLGSNSSGVGPLVLDFTASGKPAKAAPVPAAMGGSKQAGQVTRSCVPRALGENPCSN